jgi:hypothetical protein
MRLERLAASPEVKRDYYLPEIENDGFEQSASLPKFQFTQGLR